jgi:DNA polymerase (family 10)
LFEKLGIKTVKELESAAKRHKICKLKMFDEKSEKNILENIQVYKGHRERMPLNIALREANRILNVLKKVSGVKRVSEAGSTRRRQPTIGDLDLLVSSSKPKLAVDKFCKLKGVKRVLARGNTKASILLENDLQIDLRVVPDEEFGSALQYFTGSKAHNIRIRKIAIKKGMKLSEYGLFLKGKRIAGKNEADVYEALGIKMPKPENREE